MDKLIKYLIIKKKKLKKKYLPLHEPLISKNDKLKVLQGLNTGFVSTAGKDVKLFEKKIKSITKAKYVISTINGTSALHIGLKVLGVKINEEVLIPSISFVAGANAILYNNATPHFIDSEINNLGVDPVSLEKYLKKIAIVKKNYCINKKTKKIIRAIIIVHIFGHPAKMTELIKIAKKFKLKVLEDAAEGLGSFYKSKHVGNLGDVGILSFNGNKIITSGVGGAIITNNSKLARLSSHFTTTSKLKHKWEFIHDKIGYNYRLANINATLGISQINKLKKYLQHKRKLQKVYKSFLKNEKNLYILNEPKNCKSNFWLHNLVLKKPSRKKRDIILQKFHKHKILARPIWTPLHKLKYLKQYPRMKLVNVDKIQNMLISIPSSYYL